MTDDEIVEAEMKRLRGEFPLIEDDLILVLAEAKVFPELEPF